MKKIIVSLIISLFSGVILFYLIQNLSPWDTVVMNDYISKFNIKTGQEFSDFIDDSINAGIIFDYLNLKNIFLLLFFGFLTISSFIAALHMLIDKLFFKKFFEEPDHILAIRRSIWLPLILVLISMVRLLTAFNFFYIVIIIFVVLLIVLIEFSFSNKQKPKPHKEAETVKENDSVLEDLEHFHELENH